jgi:hypothetical protein
MTGWLPASVFVLFVLVGTFLEPRVDTAAHGSGPGSGTVVHPQGPTILAADLHVHPYPGDGSLPVWELQREAARRGLDVIAVTGHNNRVGLELGRLVPLDPDGPIVLPGQELTAPRFHMVAIGIEQMIDWRLPAREAIAAIHALGGVAIAAHPFPVSWREDDDEALRILDGAELAHPSSLLYSPARAAFQEFFRRVQRVNPEVAPIGSSDFHMTAPLGLCRTYLLSEDRSAAGALEAIRRGRTVARDPAGRLFGAANDVAAVEKHLAAVPAAAARAVSSFSRLIALGALVSLAMLSWRTRT